MSEPMYIDFSEELNGKVCYELLCRDAEGKVLRMCMEDGVAIWKPYGKCRDEEDNKGKDNESD